MGRLFCMLLAFALFASIKTVVLYSAEAAQPVFFSMLFPQLMPHMQQEVIVKDEDERTVKAVFL